MTFFVAAGPLKTSLPAEAQQSDGPAEAARLNNGNIVLVQPYEADGATSDLGITLFSENGQTILRERDVIGGQAALAGTSNVAPLTGGGFVVTWSQKVDDTQDTVEIKARVFREGGRPEGPAFSIFKDIDFNGDQHDVAPMEEGGFAVAGTTGVGGYFRAFDATGKSTSKSKVLPGVGGRAEINLDPLDDGRLVAAGSVADTGIMISRRGKISDVKMDLRLGAGTAENVTLSPFNDGQVLVVGSVAGVIRGKVLGRFGGEQVPPFDIGVPLDGRAVRPDVATLPDGGAVVVWSILGGTDAAGYARRISSDGVPTEDAVELTCRNCDELSDIHVESLASGDVIVTYSEARFGSVAGAETVVQRFATELSEDVIEGTEARDVIRGTADSDVVVGFGGSDQIEGRLGPDVLHGRTGRDTIEGGLGRDWLDGGQGADRLIGGEANDVLLGGLGDDRLFGNTDDDLLMGGVGDDGLIGGPGRDTVNGGEGNDRVSGDHGSDLLHGGDGDDRVLGASGDDTLIGGAGINTLVGGSGADTFILLDDDGTQYVNDFDIDSDWLDISDLFAGTVTRPDAALALFAWVEDGNTILEYNRDKVILLGVDAMDVLGTRMITEG